MCSKISRLCVLMLVVSGVLVSSRATTIEWAPSSPAGLCKEKTPQEFMDSLYRAFEKEGFSTAFGEQFKRDSVKSAEEVSQTPGVDKQYVAFAASLKSWDSNSDVKLRSVSQFLQGKWKENPHSFFPARLGYELDALHALGGASHALAHFYQIIGETFAGNSEGSDLPSEKRLRMKRKAGVMSR